MSPTIVTLLTLISGICWTIVYIEMIRRGFLDKTYGMPIKMFLYFPGSYAGSAKFRKV